MSRHHHRICLASISLTLISGQRFKIILDIRNTSIQPTDTLTDTSRQLHQLTSNLRKLTGGSIHPIERKLELALHWSLLLQYRRDSPHATKINVITDDTRLTMVETREPATIIGDSPCDDIPGLPLLVNDRSGQ